MDAPVINARLPAVVAGLRSGTLIPFLSPELTLLEAANAGIPASSEQLIQSFGKRVPIPGRFRKNLTSAAQYIETFRHRKVLRTLMCEAYAQPAMPSVLHLWLAAQRPPLIVDLGYDAASAAALAATPGLVWGQAQGVSRAESRAGQGVDWFACYDAAGQPCPESEAAGWQTLLYKPVGSITPAGNFIVSDADYVEVLTEIDVQTPIPSEVQRRRAERGFVFIGCRFDTQLHRTWARQVIKRSAGPHYALINLAPEELSRNERKFADEQGIQLLPVSAKQLLGSLD